MRHPARLGIDLDETVWSGVGAEFCKWMKAICPQRGFRFDEEAFRVSGGSYPAATGLVKGETDELYAEFINTVGPPPVAIPGAKEALEALTFQVATQHVITARTKLVAQRTQEHLRMHFSSVDFHTYAWGFHGKKGLAIEEHEIDILVEDGPYEIDSILSKTDRAFIVAFPNLRDTTRPKPHRRVILLQASREATPGLSVDEGNVLWQRAWKEAIQVIGNLVELYY